MMRLFHSSFRRSLLLGIVLLAFLPTATSGASLPDNRVITFSAGYRLGDAGGHNVVELGIAEQCGTSWCYQLARYHGADNLPRSDLPFRHRMHAPYRSAHCNDAAITTVLPSLRSAGLAHVDWDNQKLLIKIGHMSYHWHRDPEVRNGYVLKDISANANVAIFDQVAGFGFSASSTVTGPLDQASIAAYFHGQIYHKSSRMSAADPWHFKQSSADFRRYESDDTGKTLFMSIPGHPDVVRRIGKPAWVQFSVILDRNQSVLTPVVQEYGHDFNMNGCFDEAGHNKLLLPVGSDAGNVVAFVYIEYSPDKRDGVPMISVGRYYR